MTDLLILGVDVHGIEAREIAVRMGGYRFLGFVSHTHQHADNLNGYPVLGGPDVLSMYPDAARVALHVWKRPFEDDANWVSLIDPSAFVSESAKVGRGSIVYPHCFIGANAALGDGVFMLSGAVVNHDCVIGNRAVLTSRATLAGAVTVGAGAYLGQACTVRQYLTIGENAFIGMGAVVLSNVPDGVTVIGNPARVYQAKE